MLVLSRKLNQQIRINDRITLTILRVQGKTVRIGVEAPKDVHVVRGELAPLDCDEPDTIRAPLARQVISARFPGSRDSSQRPEKPPRDHRQTSSSFQHPERWTVSSMKDRTRNRSEAGHSASRSVIR